jgi:hypothetical protein
MDAVAAGPLQVDTRPAIQVHVRAEPPSAFEAAVQRRYARAFAGCFRSALASAAARHEVVVGQASTVVAFAVDPRTQVLAADVKVGLPGLERRLAERLGVVAARTCPFIRDAPASVAVRVFVNGRLVDSSLRTRLAG